MPAQRTRHRDDPVTELARAQTEIMVLVVHEEARVLQLRTTPAVAVDQEASGDDRADRVWRRGRLVDRLLGGFQRHQPNEVSARTLELDPLRLLGVHHARHRQGGTVGVAQRCCQQLETIRHRRHVVVDEAYQIRTDRAQPRLARRART